MSIIHRYIELVQAALHGYETGVAKARFLRAAT